VTVHIGCSGWHYLHWRGDFYPENTKTSEFLKLYLASFNTVEKRFLLGGMRFRRPFNFRSKLAGLLPTTKS